MISFTEASTQYLDLSNNSASTNATRGQKLANIEHRYLLQKYFNNEGSFSTTTVGSQSLVATSTLAQGDTSATLTVAWAYHTTQVNVTFSNGDVRLVQVLYNSTSITWTGGLSDSATTALAFGGCQFYPAPPNFSKLKTVTITQGNLKWTPNEVLSRPEWDRLNVFPYYSDIPVNFFEYPGGDHGVQVGIWPIPSTTGNVITYNYKFRVPDLSIADVASSGTLAVTSGSYTVTSSGTPWTLTTNRSLESRWIQISQTKGDNLWYQIANVDTTSSLTLFQPYQGVTVASGSGTVGQMPLLMEDFQDMLIWKPLIFYFTSIAKDAEKVKLYEGLYADKLAQLQQYAGSKTTSVNLRSTPINRNGNLYPSTIG